nr:hypothetical protein [Deferrisoma camini]
MAGGAREEDLVLLERLGHELGCGHGLAHVRHVEDVSEQPLQDVRRVLDLQSDVDPRVPGREPGDEPGQEVGADGRAGPHPHRPPAPVPQGFERLSQFCHFRLDPLHPVQQRAAGIRQEHALPDLLHQGHAEDLGKAAHLGRYGRLGEPELLAGPGEAAVPGHGPEYAKLVEGETPKVHEPKLHE